VNKGSKSLDQLVQAATSVYYNRDVEKEKKRISGRRL
jgi:hypothetical protein